MLREFKELLQRAINTYQPYLSHNIENGNVYVNIHLMTQDLRDSLFRIGFRPSFDTDEDGYIKIWQPEFKQIPYAGYGHIPEGTIERLEKLI